LVFEDKSGQIPGKYWDASEEDAQKFQVGKIVQLEGRRDLYQGKPQVNITRLGLLDADTVDMSQFVQTAPMKKVDMENEFDDVFIQITNGAWNRIVRYLFKKYHDRFFTSAAAKSNHHDFQGGWPTIL
jgi:Predicted HD-superfamily hydrolase